MVHAQAAWIAGVVLDSANRAIPRTQVSATGVEIARTSIEGTFRVRVQPGTVLRFRRIGYRSTTVSVTEQLLAIAETLRVVLSSAPEHLAGVFIPGAVGTPLASSVTRATIQQVPPLGEADVFRILPLLPGVSQPNDLSGRVHLAGAAGDETQLTLDGHPIQAPAHLTGVVGALNVPSVERVEVRAHHVPATEFARAGGVIDMRTRELAESWSGEAAVSMLSASATVTHPHAMNRIGVLASIRRSYLREAVRLVAPGSTGEPALTPAFNDALLRLSSQPHRRLKVAVLGYRTADHREPDAAGDNQPLLSSESLVGVSATGEGATWVSRLRASWNVATAEDRTATSFGAALSTTSSLRSLAAQFEGRFGARSAIGLSADHLLRASEFMWNGSGFVTSPGLPFRFDGRERQSLTGLAIELRHDLTRPVTTRLGTRFSSATGSSGWTVEPRLLIDWRPSSAINIDLAVDRRYQYDAEFAPPLVRSGSTPVFFVARPRRMDGIAVGVSWTGSTSFGTVAIETKAFARRYFDRPVGSPVAQDTVVRREVSFERVRARSSGIASGLTLRSTRGATLQAAYTFSTVAQEESNAWRRADWDRPHVASMLLNIPLGARWSIGAAYRGQSGLPVTPLEAVVWVPSPVDPQMLTPRLVLGERNAARVAAFNRLDLVARRMWNRGPREWTLSFQLINALASDNAIEYQWGLTGLGTPPSEPRLRPGLPIIPSIGLEVRW